MDSLTQAFHAQMPPPTADQGIHSSTSGGSSMKAGRPKGASESVSLNPTLGFHHFAFLRSGVEGLPLAEAAERYMLGLGRVDARTAKALERRLLRQVITAAQALNDATLSIQLEALTQSDDAQTVGYAPSLEDFADEHGGMDFYGQEELLTLYTEKYGDVAEQLKQREGLIRKRLRALETLQRRLAHIPSGDDAVALWIPADLSQKLRTFGVITLNHFITFINGAGRTWHRKIARLGPVRAKRLLTWLAQNQEGWQEQLKPSIYQPEDSKGKTTALVHHAGRRSSERALQFGMVPLDWLDVPNYLSGAHGQFRSQEANTFNANSDSQAIKSWLNTLAAKSPNTLKTYKREIERFYLWCLLEAHKPLSSVDANDCMAYRAFILKPPAHWVCALPVARSSSDWRPFRGALISRSASLALTAVSALFKALHASHYLLANPMPAITSSNGTAIKMDVMRSFTQEDLTAIKATLSRLPDKPSTTRLHAFLAFLLSTGLRVSEACSASWRDIESMREGRRESQMLQLRVIGKGQRERLIPLRDDVLALLALHLEQTIETNLQATVQKLSEKSDWHGLMAAIANVNRPLFVNVEKKLGAQSSSAWSVDSSYAALKRFFAKVAQSPEAVNSHGQFLKASGHWLRHTFAHSVLESADGDLLVAKELLGHTSIVTTQIYAKADMTKRARVVASMPSF